MSNKMSKMSSILLSLCELVVGILLLVSPVSFTTGIIQFVGIVLIIGGVISVVQYFRTEPEVAVAEQSLTHGLIEILLGCFCAFNSQWFIATFPILTILYGIGTLVTGIAKVQWMIDMIRLKVKKWFLMGIAAVLTIICAVIILCNPFSSTAVLWMFIAITLIVEAVIDVIATIFAKK